jgi:phospholipase D1/2
VVDRSIAFVGGIDLCFGRWDTHSHELTDDSPTHPCVGEKEKCASVVAESTARYSCWIGKDYVQQHLYKWS